MLSEVTEINIASRLPIINRLVAVPDQAIDKKIDINTALAAITGSSIMREFGRLFFTFPVAERSDLYPDDWYQQLRDASY